MFPLGVEKVVKLRMNIGFKIIEWAEIEFHTYANVSPCLLVV